MHLTRRRSVAVVAACLVGACAACDSSSRGPDAAAAQACPPEEVEVIVHTGPGGGADVLAREIVSMMEQTDTIPKGSWTVSNHDGGDGAVALNYLREQAGRGDAIMMTSIVHLANDLLTDGVDVNTLDGTPLVSLYDDRMAIAVNTDSPYETLQDFIDDAKAHPGELVQSGGSATAHDALVSQILQAESGADWDFLSFEDGGPRVTALLRGDSQLYMTEPADMQEGTDPADVKVVAIAGDKPSSIYPDAPTTADLGFTEEIPPQTRGVIGPPDMPEEAVECFEETFSEFVETDEWKTFVEETDVDPQFRTSDEFGPLVQDQYDRLEEVFSESGQLAEQ